jgi:hypothetical protein
VELEFAILECPSQVSQKSLAEENTEHLDGQEEGYWVFAAGDPSGAIGADTAAGDDTMDVRMKASALTIP